ncbi:MAG: hypothetical protein L0H83_13330, partial [Salinisphaera sp.]|nr:hypothetical protein [Salinisphaera sp.]
ADGLSAPRLGEIELSAQTAREYHQFLVRQVVRMLSIGLIHGDLSAYNVLVGTDGPVIIDLPQVVSAAGNNAARTMLRRDVGNITISLSRFAPELLDTHYAEEMWALYERGQLRPDSELSGHFVFDDASADIDSVMQSIIDAREEAVIRQQGHEAAARSAWPSPLKSPTAIDTGLEALDPTTRFAAGAKRPVPSPSSTETSLLNSLSTTRSAWPSPLK